jgi:hypothetical protein
VVVVAEAIILVEELLALVEELLEKVMELHQQPQLLILVVVQVPHKEQPLATADQA